ncbi:MAG: VOC family protein [Planctomycetaceae bacterium]|nr:VOC family protein [Planctomycetaceae bacterium]
MSIIPVKGLYETHLNVRDLERSIAFYRDVIGLEQAFETSDPRLAFFWVGGRERSMLGLWESGNIPNVMRLHLAFQATVEDVLSTPSKLVASGLQPLGINEEPVEEPVVIGWVPCVSIYFNDPDGHLLEYIAPLDEPPRPEVGVIPYSEWLA